MNLAKKIINLEETNNYLKEISDNGSFYKYHDYDESIIYRFESFGGKFEDKILFIKFKHVQIFQLGLSLTSSFSGIQPNEIRQFDISDVKQFISHDCHFDSDTSCFIFFEGNQKTNYYVVCESIESYIQDSDCERQDI